MGVSRKGWKRDRKRINQTKSNLTAVTGLNADYIWMTDMLCEHIFFLQKC